MIEIKTTEQTQSFAISTRLLMQEALRKGYTLYYFPASPSGGTGVTRAVKGGKELFFKSTCSIAAPFIGYTAADDKVQTYSLLASYGISMPYTQVLSPQDSADTSLLKRFESLVVKPTDTNHGDGITVGITTKDQLVRAIGYARAAGGAGDVLIQEQVYGTEYRFLVVEGRVAAVAYRRPPFIVGDGHLTVLELIEQKNEDPRRGDGHSSELTRISLDDVRHHKGEEFLRSIPGKGEEVNVLETSNLSRGGESVDCTDRASKALKKLAIEAAQKCFLQIAGVDIITRDIEAETDEGSYVIEVNVGPGLRMHQFPSFGTSRDVAKTVFRSFEKTARPVGKVIRKIGRTEPIELTDLFDGKVLARIDTGATTSSLWASDIKETEDGLEFCMFDPSSPDYTGERITVKDYGLRAVSSSMGHVQTRYQIRTRLKIKGKRKWARFTLADRSTQVYPVLIGRNVLRNSFVVDVMDGRPDRKAERMKRSELDAFIQMRNEEYKV